MAKNYVLTNRYIPGVRMLNGLRDNRRGSWQGKFLANFKRGNGDNMGVAGGLNDRAAIPVLSNLFILMHLGYII